ncbi:hypothetical protein SBY92_003308 [Candida maltosa Xu316]|uniref:Potassium channel tetramerisation-type BTB domain-containing protein n=1 Tax=Candida maltosa (strain Xu316) TaxID=1245528 RepID=M3JZG3_CANMX|nr:hypothetical protein G210_1018 [Candida maltosa Xu316]
MSTNPPIATTEEYNPQVPPILPHEKVYSIQVGYKLFRLSGLSLSSDAPSYFTKFFEQPDNEEKILFFDRNPLIFEKIYNHLQGYSININNDFEFVHLWSDCFYFGLKRLQKILSEQDLFANIGNQTFRIPQSLINIPGNSPNFFTINYDRLLIDNLNLIESKNMLRPPPQTPPTVNNRSSELFHDLLEFSKGNNLIVRNDDHRQLLIREARYYRFLELEQRLIKHRLSPFGEIILNINDISRKGLLNPSTKEQEMALMYCRPFIKEQHRELIFQIDAKDFDQSELKIVLNKKTKLPTVKITNKACHKLQQVFKDHISEVLIDDKSLIFLVGFTNSTTFINGKEMNPNWVNELLGIDNPTTDDTSNKKKRKIDDQSNTTDDSDKGDIIEINLSRSLWKLVSRGHLARLHAVTLEGFTCSSDTKIDFL